jgi:hypothetical protein
MKTKINPRNIGVGWYRAVRDKTASGQINLEKIFMEEWDSLNLPKRFHGMGIAQALMIIRDKEAKEFDGPDKDFTHVRSFCSHEREVCVYDLTEREQRIIATIIQWLGTNVGFSFLSTCLKKANYDIQEVKKPVEIPKSDVPVKTGRFRLLDLI